MVGTKLFLEKAKLIEMIALEFGINKHDVHQNKRNSLMAVDKKAFDDYHQLMRRIAYFVCHAEEKYDECNCCECTTLIKVLSAYGARCLSLYDFIIKQNVHSSARQSIVNMAFLDFFILQLLKRAVSELKAKFESNRILFYLNEYVEFLITEDFSSKHPLKTFLKKHTASVPCGLYVDKARYRVKSKNKTEYQPWDSFIEEAVGDILVASRAISLLPGDAMRNEAFGWHCAGNVIYRLFKLAHILGQIHAPWRENKSILNSLNRDMDFIYNSYLSLDNDVQFDLLRRDEVQFNLLINNIVEFHLFLSKEATINLPLDKGMQLDFSFDKRTVFESSFGKKERGNLLSSKSAQFDLIVDKKNRELVLTFDKTMQTAQSDSKKMQLTVTSREGAQFNLDKNKEAQFNLSYTNDTGVELFFDERSQLKLLIDENAKFILSPNRKGDVRDSCFENVREYRYEEIRRLISAFESAINNAEISANKSVPFSEVKRIKKFCEAALNEMPIQKEITKAGNDLKALFKSRGSSRYTCLVAWCIFIAKCKLGNFNEGKKIQYCESKIAEHRNDYISWSLSQVKSILKNRAPHVNFKNDTLYRLGYMGVYNQLVTGCFEGARVRFDMRSSNNPPMLSLLKKEKYSGKIIHPFTEIEDCIDDWLRWKNHFSLEVEINESSINSDERKTSTESLSWLVIPNVIAPQDNNFKMKLCIMCAVRLYPELMTLIGLSPSLKYQALKIESRRMWPGKHGKFMDMLGPCQCQKINEIELNKNKETESWNAICHDYYGLPIVR